MGRPESNDSRVELRRIDSYDAEAIYAALPAPLFDVIQPGHRVVLKPNWVCESHQDRPGEWEQVITHPTVITAVLRHVLRRLDGRGSVAIVDAPTTDASFAKLISRYPTTQWREAAAAAGVSIEILDLRDHEWTVRGHVVVDRRKLPGDPRGSTEVDLVDELSEFWQHRKSRRGYYGADYDLAETNRAHDGHHNRYRVSRTVIEGDVFINLPKLKTHRKAGITACLKNLVGINTYKNFLPHHSEGSPREGGDQYPRDRVAARVEGRLAAFVKQRFMRSAAIARVLTPMHALGRKVFGETNEVVRSGNWHGNDTLWRMVLDLNKVALYARPDGTLRPESRTETKHYIGIVDAITAGHGEGPLTPDPINMGLLICGTNAVAIDATCAAVMGFDPRRIPMIANAFAISRYPIVDGKLDDVRACTATSDFSLWELPSEYVTRCTPQSGWLQVLEDTQHAAAS